MHILERIVCSVSPAIEKKPSDSALVAAGTAKMAFAKFSDSVGNALTDLQTTHQRSLFKTGKTLQSNYVCRLLSNLTLSLLNRLFLIMTVT